MKQLNRQECKNAIDAIKSNYPPERYSMLREALDLAIVALQMHIDNQPVGGHRG